MSTEQIRGLEDKIALHEDTLDSIKRLRNQHLAHLDANPQPKLPLIKKDLDQLIECLKEVFNRLSSGHRGSEYSWSFQERRSAWETQEILRILQDDAARSKEEADALLNQLENE